MAELVVVYGPSGVGKTTLIKKLTNAETKFSLNVSHTTRPPRPTEENGIHYHFVDERQFDEMNSRGEFMETFEYIGNKYGTSYESIENCLLQEKIPVLDVNVKTVREIKGRDFVIRKRPVYMFVKPPSVEELRRRLVIRGDAEENVLRRMQHAAVEIQEGQHYADEIIINDDLESTYNRFKCYLLSRCNV